LVTTSQPLTFQSARLEERGAVVHVVETGGELAQWLRRGRATAAIIRPDRTVMLAGRDQSKLFAAVPEFSRAVRTERSDR
ncbi:MAG: 3-(3-hydroxy-phenyl)propionate hydroxylase, partial [Mycobacterium sp.]|nr:3-(3-hydroxy-phenyl)propionate hydroxylase [Mycobacterium sp.]